MGMGADVDAAVDQASVDERSELSGVEARLMFARPSYALPVAEQMTAAVNDEIAADAVVGFARVAYVIADNE